MRLKRVCFVTGTRAEFGLMRSVLDAIAAHPKLKLQIVITGMHLDPQRGRTSRRITHEGWKIDRVVKWQPGDSPHHNALQTGRAMASLAGVFRDLRSDIILVVGDRVEAFAAATAGHISGCVVAHVHGGDRALGQVDDSLRHAITKLAHVHFPATQQSAKRILKLGEDRWRIHRVGSPGLDQIRHTGVSPVRGGPGTGEMPVLRAQHLALLVLHPVDPDETIEFRRARDVLSAVQSLDFDRIVIIYPNNDPGSSGVVRCWKRHARGERFVVLPDLPRPQFLGLLRDAAVLVGNSSSGIIEAASFGTPVVDIGPRQLGRERSQNVTNVPYGEAAIRRALKKIFNRGRPFRFDGTNIYGGGETGRKIAQILARLKLDARICRKLIAY